MRAEWAYVVCYFIFMSSPHTYCKAVIISNMFVSIYELMRC